jgi:serine/threonine protein phosphatase PrpC
MAIMEFGARSDAGRVRGNNEDSFRLSPEMGLFVLADGMGGLEAGEVASRLAVETVIAHCEQAEADPTVAVFGKQIEGVSGTCNRLASAVRLANVEIYAHAKNRGGKAAMGSTIVALRFVEDRVCIAHVGDSRAYLLRGGQFDQLTEDHSFVADQVRRGMLTEEEASRSKMHNVLTRALGIDPQVEVDVTEELLAEDDVYVVCSDGLFRELSTAQISGVLQETDDPQRAASRLVDLANQAGGGDNITVIVLRNSPKSARPFAKIGRWFKGSGEEKDPEPQS